MTGEAQQKLLKAEINSLITGITEDVFKFESNRAEAQKFLRNNPDVPFIIRTSSIEGYFSLDAGNQDRSVFRSALILPPVDDQSDFKVFSYINSVLSEIGTLKEYLGKCWNTEYKRMMSDEEIADGIKNVWEKFKLYSRKNQDDKVAVLSIQNLDANKVALDPTQLTAYAQKHKRLEHSGDGHTGFAMAMALNAPLVVVRSNTNSAESTRVLRPYIGNDGLIVVTGYGKPAGDSITGKYDLNSEHSLYQSQIEYGPKDIVDTVMDAGLESGDHIRIMLAICYGALPGSAEKNDSFAHRLSQVFAARGISTTIIASDKEVVRFGTNAIDKDKITFNNQRGIAAPDVHVFTTRVNGPTVNPRIGIYKPNETIQLTKHGLDFLNSQELDSSAIKNKQNNKTNNIQENKTRKLPIRKAKRHQPKTSKCRHSPSTKQNNTNSMQIEGAGQHGLYPFQIPQNMQQGQIYFHGQQYMQQAPNFFNGQQNMQQQGPNFFNGQQNMQQQGPNFFNGQQNMQQQGPNFFNGQQNMQQQGPNFFNDQQNMQQQGPSFFNGQQNMQQHSGSQDTNTDTDLDIRQLNEQLESDLFPELQDILQGPQFF